MNDLGSHIIISQEVEESLSSLLQELKSARTVTFVEEDFKVEHAKAVVAEAYISEENKKYIVIAAKNFNSISQNALLKIFEEPPRNIVFIIIVPSKSILLPTIRSRLPILKNRYHQKIKEIEFDFSKIDNAMIFKFLKENERVKKHEAKEILEALFYRATAVDRLILTKYQLECFDKAYRLIELNSRVQSVFALVLMSFLGGSDAD
ncbi:DNA polymerase III subunit delta' [Sulfurimonas sp. HSL-1716]|uniref:DNA polymerase III subunit delta' n=1 Tax=Hydrocurvibacter sulfurireducens TaxID=3131937 RepID=UPI0031F84A21